MGKKLRLFLEGVLDAVIILGTLLSLVALVVVLDIVITHWMTAIAKESANQINGF